MQRNGSDKLALAMLASAEGFESLAYAAGGTAQVVSGVRCWVSQSRVPLFTGAAILSSKQIEAPTLRSLHDFFSRSPHGTYSMLTLDQLTPGAADRIAEQGYREYEHLPVMWLELGRQAPRLKDAPEGLHVERVENPVGLSLFREVVRRTFYMPREEVELVMSDKALEAPGVRHYLGTVEGVPAATATLVLSGQIAGVWNVGTLPEWERRGIGGAMMTHILADAIHAGYSRSMLLASQQGVPLYDRLGYSHLDTLRVMVPDLEHEAWHRSPLGHAS
jgi:GNAT superfamily N-acetyltransferase